jgi:CspA family cold shock protein
MIDEQLEESGTTMNFRDTLITCQECGKQYIFTVETQRQMAERGLDVAPPELCDVCTGKVKYGGKLHGRIKWFDLGKGYGFIAEDGGKELFFHRSSVSLTEEGNLPSLEEGQEVLYEVKDTPKGPQAIQVTPSQA